MKKLKKVICIAAVLATVFSLVACSGFSLPAFLIKGDQVESESEWNRAFDYSGVTNVTITYTYSASKEEDWVKSEVTYEFDGTRMHVVESHSSYDSDDEEPETEKKESYIFLGEDGNYHSYKYDEEDGEWVKQRDNSFMSASNIISSYISSYKSSRSSFTYSEYHKGYEKGYDADSDDSSVYDITIVKIKDGLVSVVQRQTRDEDSNSSYYTWIHAVDDTTVNIPDDIPVKPAEKDPENKPEPEKTYRGR